MTVKPDRMIYLVLCDYGRHGKAWAERDIGRTGKADTIEDIRSGELRDVLQVIELNHVEFSSRDVTEDILADVSYAKAVAAIDEVLSITQAHRFDHARDHRKHEVA